MSEFKKVNRCHHCGVILQTENHNEKGFIDGETVKKYPDGLLLCNDCYSKARFSYKPQSNLIFDQNFKKIVDVIKKKNALVVYIVDVFSFEGSFIKELNDELNGLDILVVGNKIDLLPKETDLDYFKDYLIEYFNNENLKVVDSCLVSSNTGLNIDEMYQKLVDLSKGRDVYFIGASNSGKTALIKELLKKYKNNTNQLITLYTFIDTELRGYRIPIGNKQYIFETPGLIVNNSILDKVERKVANIVIPIEQIERRSKTISKGNLLVIGGLVLFQLLSDEKTRIDTYASKNVGIYRTISGKYSVLEYKIRKGLISPLSNNIKSSFDFDCFDIKINESGDIDIGILGLGWVHFKANKQKFRIYVPKGTYIYNSRSKIKYVK